MHVALFFEMPVFLRRWLDDEECRFARLIQGRLNGHSNFLLAFSIGIACTIADGVLPHDCMVRQDSSPLIWIIVDQNPIRVLWNGLQNFPYIGRILGGVCNGHNSHLLHACK